MRTPISRLTLSRASLFSASLLGVTLLLGCGNGELSEEWTPVDPSEIEGNDAPLAPPMRRPIPPLHLKAKPTWCCRNKPMHCPRRRR